MTAPVFYDGIRDIANRTNEAAGRSWHIPSESRRRGFYVVMAVQLVVCAIPVGLIIAVWS